MVTELDDRPSLITLPNGEPVKPMFSDAEMEGRLGKLRTLMGEVGVDAVLFTSYQNIDYYADFMFCHFGRSYGLVVTETAQTSISANID